MFFAKFVQDRTQMITIANRLAMMNIVLVFLLVFATYHALTNKVIVQLIPPYLDERVTVAFEQASSNYHIKYGMYAATLLGNVNPETVSSVADALEFVFSPKLYHSMKSELSTQALQLGNEESTIEFQPKNWEYEPATKLTFVTGQQTVRSSIGKPKVKTITYEFRIEVNNYVPSITHYALYPGPARNAMYRSSKHIAQSTKS